jgi:hypothetical protein
MILPIPTGMRYTATHSACVVKLVNCCHCKKEFVYLMQRTASAERSSPMFLDNEGALDRAKSSANRALQEKLKNEFNIVPCVHCRKYQPEMAKRLRLGHHAWLAILGLIIAALGAAIILVTQWPDQEREPNATLPISKLLIYPGIGLALVAVYVGLWITFDPNDMDEAAKSRLCESPSIDHPTFDARMAEAQQSGQQTIDLLAMFRK